MLYNKNSNSKACVIIVTYNRVPRLDIIISSIKAKEIDGLIIIDNSNRAEVFEGVENQLDYETKAKFLFIANKKNLGISKALNLGFQNAMKLGYDYFFLLDDDASISKDFFISELTVCRDLLSKRINVGIVCPIVSNDRAQLNKHFKSSLLSEVKNAITSGLLIRAEAIKKVGGYNEDFFLEWADIDFTLRVFRNGFKIFRINKILVAQDFGETINSRGIPSHIYGYLLSIISRIMLHENRSNDFQPKPFKYAPNRHFEINKWRAYFLRKNNTNILYFYWAVLIGSMIGISLFFITGDSGYVQAVKGFFFHEN